MIPYEELERALARWKTRRASATGSVPVATDATNDLSLPPPPDRTGEIDLGDDSVESVESAEGEAD